uniref:Uncharacterized protein n=1 Tax=Trypanosoma vivax (strain Y486) TaxID=1055687 RepID=G0TWR2_TRYVY|nr:hypothetical protein TVY486_0601910 [Trypanosoma vivax Y486]
MVRSCPTCARATSAKVRLTMVGATSVLTNAPPYLSLLLYLGSTLLNCLPHNLHLHLVAGWLFNFLLLGGVLPRHCRRALCSFFMFALPLLLCCSVSCSTRHVLFLLLLLLNTHSARAGLAKVYALALAVASASPSCAALV